jgi:hypothetical protein
MPQERNGHIEDGRFGVTRVNCRCQACYKGFVRTGAEALIPLNGISNQKINKILNIILAGSIDSFYPTTYEEWCVVKLHVCNDCWQKSMSRKIKKQQDLIERRRQEEMDPIESAKNPPEEDNEEVEEILRRYEEIKEMIRSGSYIRKPV